MLIPTALHDRKPADPPLGLALYGQIASIFRARIVSGEWPKGLRLEPIRALCVEYGVAPITIRQALQILSREGMISSKRGSGTFVTYHPERSTHTVGAAIEQALSVGPDHAIYLLEKRTEVASPPGEWAPGTLAPSYVRFKKVHWEAGAPYSIADAFVSHAIYNRFPEGAEENDKVIRLVRDHGQVRVTGGRERFTIESANFRDAGLLKCPQAAPLARVHRWFYDEGGILIFYSDNLYRGDRFALEQDFTNYINRIW